MENGNWIIRSLSVYFTISLFHYFSIFLFSIFYFLIINHEHERLKNNQISAIQRLMIAPTYQRKFLVGKIEINLSILKSNTMFTPGFIIFINIFEPVFL